MLRLALAVLLLVYGCHGDVYMHNPRGSNNRLDEKGRERANANRMFDSQNNNRGGYNVGSLYYYEDSVLPIEWTNQHSCGEANADCQLIVQYMCDDQLRDGTKTRTIPENRNQCENYDCNSDLEYGMNENYDWYMNCKYRERNQGLFTADQNVNGKTAKYTRQNPNGNRRGYECPEERDYYPYWHPTPWKDIAIMTNDIRRCEEFQAESQNVKEKYSCVPPAGYMEALVNKDRTALPNKYRKNLPLNKEDCEKIVFPIDSNKTALWTETKPWGLDAPACISAPKSRDNHNGNGPTGFANMYNWTIPKLPHEHCALRLRYNISTSDYNITADASLNKQGNNQETGVDIGALVGLSKTDAEARGYVFKNNPTVEPLKSSDKLKLQLAINTAQYGRTFQDRSHSFAIRKREPELAGVKIHNLNVRGKRGNIVQVYPAVEYDFVPNRLEASKNDYIHIQWTGSNTNPNNNDGQGLRGTDRSNIVLLTPQQYPEGTPGKAVAAGLKKGHFGNSYPDHLNTVETFLGLSKEDTVNLAVLTPGQFRGELSELDDAGTYFDLPPRKITSVGTFFYMSTRNNNFSNRSQKGKIVVSEAKSSAAEIGFSGGNVQLDDNNGVWVKAKSSTKTVKIVLEEWDKDAGNDVIASKGGELKEGDDYSSKFFVIYPFGDLTGGEPVTVKMEVDDSDTTIYHSTNYKDWTEVSGVEISDNVATFSTQKGGVFVGRSEDSANTSAIVGGVVGTIVILVLIVAVVYFCRKNPSIRSKLDGLKMGKV